MLVDVDEVAVKCPIYPVDDVIVREAGRGGAEVRTAGFSKLREWICASCREITCSFTASVLKGMCGRINLECATKNSDVIPFLN